MALFCPEIAQQATNKPVFPSHHRPRIESNKSGRQGASLYL
jgi:hypothetical protein